ncbi:MAG: hypothetical protein CM15mP44_6530 [Candidatus Neomarinimicrobiota bacterium]|nr:MAG: hypothetical protein CM15mP44_6530 [Candidatus Neomarinimicrobiota bacterium]
MEDYDSNGSIDFGNENLPHFPGNPNSNNFSSNYTIDYTEGTLALTVAAEDSYIKWNLLHQGI